MKYDEANAYLEKIAAEIGEHFDAVQILVSRIGKSGGTQCIKRGVGNWCARQGMATEFIGEARANEQAEELGRVITPPDEGWKS